MTGVPDRLAAALAGHYTIERELGAGGMATVYLAEDVKHHRKVAVKVLRPELGATLGPDRFSREIEVAARLQHPHILGLLDSGDADGFFYYVMPYVEGETLRDRLAKHGEMPVTEAVRLLTEIADALAVAHRQGVVHRDIKPENVLLSGRHAMVMDFGVAKAVTEATGRQQLTTAGVALGTPAYMAPEQATADPHLDGRVDIYALGILGYEMLTGQPPFHGLTPQQTLAAHMTRAPEPLTMHRPGCPPALASLIARCLEKRPADRFQTADEVVTALEPLATPSGGITPTHTQPLTAVAARRAPWAVIGAGVVILGIGAVLVSRRGASGPTLALTKTSRLTSAPGLEITPAISPDGKFVAYTGGTKDQVEVFLQPIGGGRAISVTDSLPGNQYSPDWSPDGNALLFVSEDSLGPGIVTMPPTGGTARFLYRTSNLRGPLAPRWSPDGARIAFEQGDSVMVMNADGSGVRLVAAVQLPHSLSWSPDGKWLAGVRGNAWFPYPGSSYGNLAASTLFIVPSAGGAPIYVSDSTTLNLSPVWLSHGRGLLYVSSGGGGRDIYEVRLAGDGHARGTPQRLSTGLDAQSIALSRDGKRLAYSKYTRDVNIWMVRVPKGGTASASTAVQITRGNQAIEQMALSPDGKWLVYDSDLNGNADIFVIPADGGTARQVTDDPADDLAPSWSSDGSEIAFHSFRSGNRDIFTVNADGSGLTRVTSDTAQERSPYWGRDPNLLAYRQDSAETGIIYVIRRSAKGAPWGKRQRVTAAGTAAWSNDGKALLTFHSGILWRTPLDGGPTVQTSVTPGRLYASVCNPPGSNAIYFRGQDAAGHWQILALEPGRAAPRVVVTFDDASRQSARATFDTDGHRFFFTIADHQSDIWIADLEPR